MANPLALLIGKSLKVASNLVEVALSTDAGNLLGLGSDNAPYFGVTTASVDIDATTPAPAVATQFLWSTLLGCYMRWNGSSWQQATMATNNITITETGGSGSNAWLVAAIAKALRYTTANGVTVTVQLSAASYTATSVADYNFTDGDFSNIIIQGAPSTTTTLVSCGSATLVSGTTYNVTFTLASVTGFVVGQYVGLSVINGAAGYWANLNGLWPITAVNSGANTITVQVRVQTGTSLAAQSSLTGTAITWTSILYTQYGVQFVGRNVKSLTDFMIIQQGVPTAGTSGLTIDGKDAVANISNVGIYGFSTNGSAMALYVAHGGRVGVSGLYASFCGSGIFLDQGATFDGWAVLSSFAPAGSGLTGWGVDIYRLARFRVTDQRMAAINCQWGVNLNVLSEIYIEAAVSYKIGGTSGGMQAWNNCIAEGNGYIANIGTCSPTRGTFGNNASAIYS
ncbi:hypothetical protein [Methylosinus sp. PW1]|uniref:hypothetical protein n=1 Tax=Methylosinus sp. PW1 TaxID=107636 RepID=UPI00056631A2|nr:hypothetical protein [Methylosinus sp. PW1]